MHVKLIRCPISSLLRGSFPVALVALVLLAGCAAGEEPLSAPSAGNPAPTPVAAEATAIPPEGAAAVTPTPPASAGQPGAGAPTAELPLAPGTTWVYSYEPYEPTEADPSHIISATYLITETVVETQDVPPYQIAHLRRDSQLLAADPAWVDDAFGPPADSWYVVLGPLVYESTDPVDPTQIQTETLSLLYDLPLSVGKSWCSEPADPEDPQGCQASGQRTVVRETDCDTPAGRFSGCLEITESYNSGGETEWFSPGIGPVAYSYDHIGTRFGHRQALISYSPGQQAH